MARALCENDFRVESTSTTLVALDPALCPACRVPVATEVVHADALFSHAGYGATLQVARRYCSCGWALVSEVSEAAPRR